MTAQPVDPATPAATAPPTREPYDPATPLGAQVQEGLERVLTDARLRLMREDPELLARLDAEMAPPQSAVRGGA